MNSRTVFSHFPIVAAGPVAEGTTRKLQVAETPHRHG